MKRKTKNIAMITILLLMIGAMAFTIYNAKKYITINDSNFQNKIPSMNQNEPMGTPPEKKDGNSPNENNGNVPLKMPNDKFNQENKQPDIPSMNNNLQNKNSIIYYIILGIESLIISSLINYLIMSKFNKKTLKETLYSKDKFIIIILSTIILTSIILVGSTYSMNNNILTNDLKNESSEKETITLNKSNIISSNEVNLDEQKTDVTIKQSGEYSFTGTFNHSIIIDAEDEDVEIILNNVTIENSKTAAIIGLSANKITINLSDGTTNTLSDGGNSEYDGCIFSNAELEFIGSGKLIINGNQNEGEGIATEAKNIIFNGGTYIITSNDDGINAGGDGASIIFNDGEFYIDASGDGIDSNKDAIINGGTIFVMGSDIGGDAGIDTDDGFTINGGTVIALGSDMIETPLESSKQKSICFSLNSSIAKDTIVTLMKDNEEIISFKVNKSFKTIIISSEKLVEGNYEIYINGSNTGNLVNGIYKNSKYTKGDKLTVNDETSFKVSKKINLYKENK